MRKLLFWILFTVAAASAASAQLGPFPGHGGRRPILSQTPLGSGVHGRPTSDSLAPQVIQVTEGGRRIRPRSDIHGPADALGPEPTLGERIATGAAVGAAIGVAQRPSIGVLDPHCGWESVLLGGGIGTATGFIEGLLSNRLAFRSWIENEVDAATTRH